MAFTSVEDLCRRTATGMMVVSDVDDRADGLRWIVSRFDVRPSTFVRLCANEAKHWLYPLRIQHPASQ